MSGRLVTWFETRGMNEHETPETDAIRGVEEVVEALDTLEKLGVQVEPMLRRSLGALSVALSTGKEVGEAAKEAENRLRAFSSRVAAGCYNMDPDEIYVCLARHERQWPSRAIDATLNIKNQNSVIRIFIEKQLSKLTNDSLMEKLGRFVGLPLT